MCGCPGIKQRLLSSLKTFWIDDYLHQLHITRQQNLEIIFSREDLSHHAVTSGTENQILKYQINELIQSVANGRFTLLLGKGGAGKTIAMLQILEKFIDDADKKDPAPIPILLNLASWKEGSISDWMAREIYVLLKIKQKDFQMLAQKQRLFLMLDGLDEVKPRLQPRCIKEINKFYEDHPESSILVGCRQRDYEASSTNLYFDHKFCVQPLTLTQIDDYLEKLGDRLEGLREAIKRDGILQNIAQTPLMLFVMSRAYEGIKVEDLPQLSQDIRENHIWRNYVDRMFLQRYQDEILLREKKKDKKQVEIDKNKWQSQKARGLFYLTNLAVAMLRDSQSIFLIERISNKWLQKKSSLYTYRFITFLIGSIIGALSCALIPNFSGFNEIVSNSPVLQKTIGERKLLVDILSGILLGGGGGIFISFSNISQVELSVSEFVSLVRPYLFFGVSIIQGYFILKKEGKWD